MAKIRCRRGRRGPHAGRNFGTEPHGNEDSTGCDLPPPQSAEASIVLSAIMPEWVSVTYYDPQMGSTVTKTMYANNNPASYLIKHPDGTEWWSGITFPLIEK